MGWHLHPQIQITSTWGDAMALLLLDRAQLEIKAEGDALALYEAGTRRGTIPVKLVDRCVIHGAQTRIHTGVLMKLAESGATVVLMSPRQPRSVATLYGNKHNDASIRLAQAKWVLDDAHCQSWARQIVIAKLNKQRKVVESWLAQRPDCRKPLWDARNEIDSCLRAMTLATENSPQTDLARFRGLEGTAARAHFSALAAVVPPSLGFTGRNRRPPRDPINTSLSLAYTMLHVMAVQACNRSGLDPMLGFYHRPCIGRESLACDIIEPLRAQVDWWVWSLFRQRILRDDHFSMDKGACILGKTGRAVFYAEWEKDSKALQRWLSMQTQQLARQLRQSGMLWLDSEEPGDAE